MQAFIAPTERTIVELLNAQANGDIAPVQTAARKLESAARAVTFTDRYDTIEAVAKSGDRDTVNAQCVGLQDLMIPLVQYIEQL